MSKDPTCNSNEIQPIKEYSNIISCLPTENGWMSNGDNPLYLYQGFWCPSLLIHGAIAAHSEAGIPGFNPSPSNIILASNPKSGTTWLKALSFAIATRARFPIQSFEEHPLNSSNPHELIPMIELKFKPNPHHSILSTHLPYTSLPRQILASECKIVYIWRDPKDAFISLWQFMGKIRAVEDVAEPIPLVEAFELFCRGISHVGPYWDHVLGYWKAHLERPEKVLFLKYEDMMSDVEVHVKRLAEFIGCPFSSGEEEEGVVSRIVDVCSFGSLSGLEVNKSGDGQLKDLKGENINHAAFFRKGKVGDWKNYLTDEMASKMDQITLEKLATSGLPL